MLVDTDVLIWYLRGRQKAAEALNVIPRLTLSAVNYMELVQGCRSKDELERLKRDLSQRHTAILPITTAITHRATSLVETHFLGNGLQMVDALIAATCLEHGLRLLTANMKHFVVVPDLAIEAFEP